MTTDKNNQQDAPTEGQTRMIPIGLSSGTILVECLLVERRVVFGRVEWLVTPVSGEGAAWITEDTILLKTNARVLTKSAQRTR